VKEIGMYDRLKIAVKDKVHELFTKEAQKPETWTEKISHNAADFKDKVNEFINSAVEQVYPKKEAEKDPSFYEQLKHSAKEKFQELLHKKEEKKLEESFTSKIAHSAGDLKDKVGTAIGDAFGRKEVIERSFAERIQDATNEKLAEAKHYFEGKEDELKHKFEAEPETLTDKIAHAAGDFKAKINGYADKVMEQIKPEYDHEMRYVPLQTQIKKESREAKEKVEDIVDKVEHAIGSTFGKTATKAENIKDSAKATIKDIKNAAADKAHNVADTASGIADGFESRADAMKASAKEMINDIKNAASNQAQNIADKASDLKDAIGEKLGFKKPEPETFTDKARKEAKQIVDEIAGVKDIIVEKAKNLTDEIRQML